MKTSLFTTALATLTLPVFGGNLTRIDRETDTSFAKNLAREHIGASSATSNSDGVALTLGDRDSNTSPRGMVLSDPSIGFHLPAGRNVNVLDLRQVQVVDRVSFVNRGGSGKVIVRTATSQGALSSGQFSGQSYTVFQSDDTVVNVDLGGVDARYISVESDMAEAGRLYDFGVFGPKTASSYALTYGAGTGNGVGSAHRLAINVLAPYAGADVRYISSGSSASVASLVDEDASSVHSFSRSDKGSVVVVDTGRSLRVTRASALVSARAAGEMDVYLLDQLPEAAGWNDTAKLDSDFLNELTPVGSVAYQAGVTPVGVNLDGSARYVVFRWRSEKGGLGVADVAAFSPDVTLADYGVREVAQGDEVAGDPDKGGIDKGGIDKGGIDKGGVDDGAIVGPAIEDNGFFPVTGYRGVLGGRNPNGLSPNFVPVCLAVSWNGRENIPEFVIEAVNRYLDATENYDACRPGILNNLTEIIQYGAPLAKLEGTAGK